jgi:hypothetical protein
MGDPDMPVWVRLVGILLGLMLIALVIEELDFELISIGFGMIRRGFMEPDLT